ncbi:MAG TPA: PEGA domain-containing protein [Polyangiaceae bacterium]|nr:PEGA domain-containing protein [Polyangiaceae bacterium]
MTWALSAALALGSGAASAQQPPGQPAGSAQPAGPAQPGGSAQPGGPAQPGAGGKAPIEEARDRYRRGVRLYEEGDFQAALVEFRRAYELSPAFQVLYNIGHVYRQLQNYAEALRWLERYLQEGGRNVPAARAEEVQREVDELRRRVALIDVTAEVAGALVFIDDELVGETPLRKPVQVSAGRRKLRVQKAGYNVFEQSFEVAGAETRTVKVHLFEMGSAAPSAAPSAVAPEPWHRWTTLSWVGLGSALAMGAGAAVTGSLAYRDASEVRDSSKDGPVDGEVRDQNARAKDLALASDVLLGAAVLTAGLTLTLTLVRSPPSSSSEARTAAPPAAWALGLGPGGVGLRHRF